MKADEGFKPLDIPHKDVSIAHVIRYRVYSDDKNFKTVDAASAKEAIALSGIAKPLRVQQEIMKLYQVMDLKKYTNDNPLVPEATLSPVPPATDQEKATDTEYVTAPVTPSTEEPKAAEIPATPASTDAPLSNDEVNKLLNGQ